MKDDVPVDSVATINIPLLLVSKDLFTTSLSWKVVSVDCGKRNYPIFLKPENMIGELCMKGGYTSMTPKRCLKKKSEGLEVII